MDENASVSRMMQDGPILNWSCHLAARILDAICHEAEQPQRTMKFVHVAASELAAQITAQALDHGHPVLYRVLADLLNLRTAETGQYWFYDAAADELSYHIVTDTTILCHSCGLRQVAGSGQLWCAVCASKV